MTTITKQPVDQQGNTLGILLRLFWMALGNFILLLSLIFIIQHEGSVFYSADVVFWITILALILVRYLDIKHCSGETAAGQPATIGHWIKYAIFLLIFSTAVWTIAHTVNYFVVNK